jgi:hypothetical protein
MSRLSERARPNRSQPRRLSRSQPARRTKWREPEWVKLPDERLLDLKFCELGLEIEGTDLEERIERLYDELGQKGISFRPHCWLSTEWFSPDGVPGIAIPFYLAHPRLKELEERQVLEVEGGGQKQCMRLLRHEAAHALDTAYRVHRRPAWREVFGRWGVTYSKYYRPKPYSKSFVLHLDLWYAQSHPAEDWAETFAVWLDPGSRWKKRYAGWPALKKLLYVDELMGEIAGLKPPVLNRERVESLPRLRQTLREHYSHKQSRYGVGHPRFYDRDLGRLFPRLPEGVTGRSAAAFLRRVRPEIRRAVARWTGEYQYTIDQVLLEMIDRSAELGLKIERDETEARTDAMLLLAVQTMNYLHGGHHRLVR